MFRYRHGPGLSATVRFNCVYIFAQVRESCRKVTELGFQTGSAKREEKLRNERARPGIA